MFKDSYLASFEKLTKAKLLHLLYTTFLVSSICLVSKFKFALLSLGYIFIKDLFTISYFKLFSFSLTDLFSSYLYIPD
jgi:hypothetical protein